MSDDEQNDDAPKPGTELAVVPRKRARLGSTGERIRRDKFIAAIVRHGSGTKAAAEAGYSPHSAAWISSRLLGKPEVKRAIQDRLNAESLTPEHITASLAEIVRFDYSNVGDKVYRFDPITGRRVVDWEVVKQLNIGHLIREVGSAGKAGHEVLKFYSKLEASTLLARILGITRDRLEVDIRDVRGMSDEDLARIADS